MPGFLELRSPWVYIPITSVEKNRVLFVTSQGYHDPTKGPFTVGWYLNLFLKCGTEQMLDASIEG